MTARDYESVVHSLCLYDGPREAIFYALLRKNLGCTHFIIGRDHAGVGNFYGSFEAHELTREIIKKYDLGITLLLYGEPYYCHRCGKLVLEDECRHGEDSHERISGTRVREMLSRGERPDEWIMRPEVADELIKLKDDMFIGFKSGTSCDNSRVKN